MGVDPSFCELAKQILCCGFAEQKLQQRLGTDSPAQRDTPKKKSANLKKERRILKFKIFLCYCTIVISSTMCFAPAYLSINQST